jgi:hypothetical protein
MRSDCVSPADVTAERRDGLEDRRGAINPLTGLDGLGPPSPKATQAFPPPSISTPSKATDREAISHILLRKPLWIPDQTSGLPE